jgi:hypothetical protein
MKKLAVSLLLGTVTLIGSAACAPAAAGAAMVASAESEALAAMGVAAEDLAVAADPAVAPVGASPSPDGAKGDRGDRLDRWRKRHAAKVALHRNVLHGEAVVQTKNGTVTVLVQRGEITAISADSVTVKSSDGFTQTWKFHAQLRVVEKRATIQPSELKAGATVALAGPKEGDSPMARLIVIPLAK